MLTLLRSVAMLMLGFVAADSPAAESPATSGSPPGESYEVAVYGDTPAGIMAAVAAARARRSVVLLEPSRHIGGMTTGGLSHTDVGRPELIGGLALEFFERAARLYDDPEKLRGRDKWYSEPRIAERAFLEMLREANVTVLTGQRLDLAGGVRKDAARIVALTTDSGRTFTAQMLIKCHSANPQPGSPAQPTPFTTLDMIAELGPAAKAAVPALASRLEVTEFDDIVRKIMAALAAIGPDARQAAGAMARAIQRTPSARESLSEYLRAVTPDAESLLKQNPSTRAAWAASGRLASLSVVFPQ